MRTLFYILLTTFLSCNSLINQADNKLNSDKVSHSPTTRKTDNLDCYTSKDTLKITTGNGDTLRYSKAKFNALVDNHPELFSDNVQGPDLTYYCAANKKEFNSETGQDEYYMLYAFFLKQKNGVAKYADRRQKLLSIYEDINSLYQRFQHGGTYFGHQGARILGYAEYSVYLYKSYENELSKTYDVSNQKRRYIQSLRQLIDDELQKDGEMLEQDKVKQKQQLNTTVDNIEKTITDNFYLRRAQEFQYEHYQYY